MRFLVDNQLPVALARFLVARGLDWLHVLDLKMGDATDAEIWDYARQNDNIVIIKDEEPGRF